jgi:hypothetical protein
MSSDCYFPWEFLECYVHFIFPSQIKFSEISWTAEHLQLSSWTRSCNGANWPKLRSGWRPLHMWSVLSHWRHTSIPEGFLAFLRSSCKGARMIPDWIAAASAHICSFHCSLLSSPYTQHKLSYWHPSAEWTELLTPFDRVNLVTDTLRQSERPLTQERLS